MKNASKHCKTLIEVLQLLIKHFDTAIGTILPIGDSIGVSIMA